MKRATDANVLYIQIFNIFYFIFISGDDIRSRMYAYKNSIVKRGITKVDIE